MVNLFPNKKGSSEGIPFLRFFDSYQNKLLPKRQNM
jgi:hypothetical protein